MVEAPFIVVHGAALGWALGAVFIAVLVLAFRAVRRRPAYLQAEGARRRLGEAVRPEPACVGERVTLEGALSASSDGGAPPGHFVVSSTELEAADEPSRETVCVDPLVIQEASAGVVELAGVVTLLVGSHEQWPRARQTALMSRALRTALEGRATPAFDQVSAVLRRVRVATQVRARGILEQAEVDGEGAGYREGAAPRFRLVGTDDAPIEIVAARRPRVRGPVLAQQAVVALASGIAYAGLCALPYHALASEDPSVEPGVALALYPFAATIDEAEALDGLTDLFRESVGDHPSLGETYAALAARAERQVEAEDRLREVGRAVLAIQVAPDERAWSHVERSFSEADFEEASDLLAAWPGAAPELGRRRAFEHGAAVHLYAGRSDRAVDLVAALAERGQVAPPREACFAAFFRQAAGDEAGLDALREIAQGADAEAICLLLLASVDGPERDALLARVDASELTRGAELVAFLRWERCVARRQETACHEELARALRAPLSASRLYIEPEIRGELPSYQVRAITTLEASAADAFSTGARGDQGGGEESGRAADAEDRESAGDRVARVLRGRLRERQATFELTCGRLDEAERYADGAVEDYAWALARQPPDEPVYDGDADYEAGAAVPPEVRLAHLRHAATTMPWRLPSALLLRVVVALRQEEPEVARDAFERARPLAERIGGHHWRHELAVMSAHVTDEPSYMDLPGLSLDEGADLSPMFERVRAGDGRELRDYWLRDIILMQVGADIELGRDELADAVFRSLDARVEASPAEHIARLSQAATELDLLGGDRYAAPVRRRLRAFCEVMERHETAAPLGLL